MQKERRAPSASARREATLHRIKDALKDAGLPELRASIYPSGAVVDDGNSLWSAMPIDLLLAARRVARERADVTRRWSDPAEQGVRLYDRFCELTTCLAHQKDDWAQLAHRRIVKAYRRDTGQPGNWS